MLPPEAMRAVWRDIAREVRETPMPPEYAALRVRVLCNDCGVSAPTRFHVVALRCEACRGYNTTRTGEGFEPAAGGGGAAGEGGAGGEEEDEAGDDDDDGEGVFEDDELEAGGEGEDEGEDEGEGEGDGGGEGGGEDGMGAGDGAGAGAPPPPPPPEGEGGA